jgi:hypothetical protein
VFVPMVSVVYLIGLVGSSGAAQLHDGIFVSSAGTGAAVWSNALNAFISVLGSGIQLYIFLATLTFLQVLISERDLVLAKSIRKAASDVQRVARTSAGQTTVVVAVVGLMHVNGVLRRLGLASLGAEDS